MEPLDPTLPFEPTLPDERTHSRLAGEGEPAEPVPTHDLPPVGAVPGYEIEAVLGHGGMGVVYRARQQSLNRTVALKMILAGSHAGREALARFRSEAELLARLQHPHVIRIFEAGICDGRPFLVLELAEGGRLDQRLARGPLLPREAARILHLLTGAVQAAHGQGILHRDLKPSNVLFLRDGTPKVADFGLARQIESDRTLSGAILGTPSYMSPEQARGDVRLLGPPSDVHGLGAILYEMLTGRPPFQGPTAQATLEQVRTRTPVPPRRLQPTIPRDLEAVCLKCLEKEPRFRYPSAEALAEDLQRFLTNRPVTAGRDGLPARIGRWMRHPRRIDDLADWYLRVGGLGLILCLAYGLIFLTFWTVMFLASYFVDRGVTSALGLGRPALFGTVGAAVLAAGIGGTVLFLRFHRALKAGRLWALIVLGLVSTTAYAATAGLIALTAVLGPLRLGQLDSETVLTFALVGLCLLFTITVIYALVAFCLLCAMLAVSEHPDVYPRTDLDDGSHAGDSSSART